MEAETTQHVSALTFEEIIRSVERALKESIEAYSVKVNDPEIQRRVEEHYKHHADYDVRTYQSGRDFLLRIYPVANLRKYAEQKAREALEKNEAITLLPMRSFERFVVHNHLKTWPGIVTTSVGEGTERRIEIRPVKYGREPRKIQKKIKLL